MSPGKSSKAFSGTATGIAGTVNPSVPSSVSLNVRDTTITEHPLVPLDCIRNDPETSPPPRSGKRSKISKNTLV